MNKAYLFEAHTIQPYILDGGKLAEMVGASEILEELIGQDGPLDIVLKEMGVKEEDDFRFARRGGGAFYMLFKDEDKAQQLKEIWSLVVNGFAPGLEFCHACCFDADKQSEAIKKAQASLRRQRNRLNPVLPEAGPYVRRSPRTGKPAQAFADNIWVDKATDVKRRDRFAKGKKLGRKFLSDGDLQNRFEFPRNMEHPDGHRNTEPEDGAFPFNKDNHNIGIIHADGNGLGQILIALADALKNPDDYARVFYELSQKIDQATQNAARKAMKETIKFADKGVIPARPLILGGDDLTIIVRADLALEYARDFITYFEEETKQQLAPLRNKYPAIPEQMTACAGIAFLRSNQPFSFGYALAEGLCSAAKTQSRNHKDGDVIPGSLAFHRVTSSFIDEYAVALDRELTAKHKDSEIQLTLGAYGVGRFAGKLPGFDDFEHIKNLFRKPEMARGPTRQFLTLVSTDRMEAEDAWRRWRKSMRNNDVLNELLNDYDRYVEHLYGEGFGELLPFKTEEDKRKTFIGDLINWMAAAGEGEQ